MNSEGAGALPPCLSWCAGDLLQALATRRRSSASGTERKAEQKETPSLQPSATPPVMARAPDEAAGSEERTAVLASRLQEESSALASDNVSLREKLKAAELTAAAASARELASEARVAKLEVRVRELESELARTSARAQTLEVAVQESKAEAVAKEKSRVSSSEDLQARFDMERRELESKIELLAGAEQRGEEQVTWLTDQLGNERAKYEEEIKRLQAAETRNEERIILMVRKQQEQKKQQEQQAERSASCGC